MKRRTTSFPPSCLLHVFSWHEKSVLFLTALCKSLLWVSAILRHVVITRHYCKSWTACCMKTLLSFASSSVVAQPVLPASCIAACAQSYLSVLQGRKVCHVCLFGECLNIRGSGASLDSAKGSRTKYVFQTPELCVQCTWIEYLISAKQMNSASASCVEYCCFSLYLPETVAHRKQDSRLLSLQAL